MGYHTFLRQGIKIIVNKVTIITSVYMLVLLIIFSCNNSATQKDKPAENLTTDTLTVDPENAGNKIDFDSTPVLRTTYVIDRNGAEVKDQADENSSTLGKYVYGTKLDVIEEYGDWIGIRDRITREFVKDGQDIESTVWEKVYILKSKTGKVDQIKLVPADLDIVSLLTINEKTEFFEKGKQLKEYLALELIDQSLFDRKKSSAVDFLVADTLSHQKVNGIIELKCQNKTVRYVDRPDAEEERQEFQYIGQVDFLDKYIIAGSYWESIDYKFIDKRSGEETNVFGEYPYISPDRKNIICIYANPYETTADLELYTILDGNIRQLMRASFKNWMPTVEPGEMFWSSDGYLYLTVNHIHSFWTESGHLNDECQYMRIKIL